MEREKGGSKKGGRSDQRTTEDHEEADRGPPHKQRHVVRNELGHDRLDDTLDKDLLLGEAARGVRRQLAIGERLALSDEPITFEIAGADEDGLERAETKVVVRLGRELLRAEVEEGDNLGCQRLGASEALGEEHDLGNKLEVGLGHSHTLVEREDERQHRI